MILILSQIQLTQTMNEKALTTAAPTALMTSYVKMKYFNTTAELRNCLNKCTQNQCS